MSTEAPNETAARVRSWRHRSGGPFQRGVERLMFILCVRSRRDMRYANKAHSN